MHPPAILAEVNWLSFGTLAVTILVQVVAAVVVLAKMHAKIDDQKEEIEGMKKQNIPDRVSKLEWEGQAAAKAVQESREAVHGIRNTLQQMAIQLGTIGEWVSEQKRKHRGD